MSSIGAVSAEKFYGTKPADKKTELNMEAFLNLLSVQMANQNPLEPMNDRDYFAQLAQLGQVQGIDKLTNQSELEQIQNLMGKEVTAVRLASDTDTGTESIVSGVATKLSIRNGERYISIREANGGEAEVKLTNVRSVRDMQRPADYANLVGKTVVGVDGLGNAVTGSVTGVGIAGGTVSLTLDGDPRKTVTIDRLTSVAG